MRRHQPANKRSPYFRTMRVTFGVAVAALVVAGGPVKADIIIDLGRGPVVVHVPPSYDPMIPTPLVLLLHGYGGSGAWQEAYMQFTPQSDEFGFLYAFPDGTRDAQGNRFWNATNACCNFYGSDVDDSGYLRDLIEAVKVEANVDERRVHLIGHSNGGFMSYRMACDHADTIASIASLAGATFLDPNDCSPAEPVHVLQIHGTADMVVRYEGGCFGDECYPGAVETVERWATYDGCLPVGEPGEPLDLDAGISGAETQVTRYVSECDPGGSGELWTIVGGSHIPDLSDDFSPLVIDYLYAHPKPGPLGDLNGDGCVDQADLGILLADWQCTGGECPGDCDGDGDTDQSDLGILLAHWGEGCP